MSKLPTDFIPIEGCNYNMQLARQKTLPYEGLTKDKQREYLPGVEKIEDMSYQQRSYSGSIEAGHAYPQIDTRRRTIYRT